MPAPICSIGGSIGAFILALFGALLGVPDCFPLDPTNKSLRPCLAFVIVSEFGDEDCWAITKEMRGVRIVVDYQPADEKGSRCLHDNFPEPEYLAMKMKASEILERLEK